MIIIHVVNSIGQLFKRHLTAQVEAALVAFPVVVLTGARQTGKSTLIRELLGGPDRDYRTLDDLDVLERAEREPDALLSGGKPLTLDEVQRNPALLLAIKRAVDHRRAPGRFLLSGSANLALLRSVSETLAGRAVYLVLFPFTQGERARRGAAGRWDDLLGDPGRLPESGQPFAGDTAALESGFPAAALAESTSVQQAWLESYVRTYLERDLQAVSSVANLVDFRRFMRAAALRSGSLVNQTEIARDAGVSQPTVHRWLNLLEASHLLLRLPAYAVNRSKRLIKSPRLFFCDSGLAAHLAGIGTPSELRHAGLVGPLLETLVLADLLAWREGLVPRPELMYWRTADGAEVDFVVERGGRVVPFEVKATSRPRPRDWHNLSMFLAEYPDLADHGVLLHCGPRRERLAERIWSVPLSLALRTPNGR